MFSHLTVGYTDRAASEAFYAAVMGSALAHCLLKAGYAVSVWNRTRSKSDPLADAGAQVCASPDEAVAASDFVLVCIKGHRETVELISGLGVSLAGKTICDMPPAFPEAPIA